MNDCIFSQGVCQTHGFSELDDKYCVEAIHEELHHYMELKYSNDYFKMSNLLATTSKLKKMVKENCKFCKEEN